MDTIGGCRLDGIAGSGAFAVTYAGEHPSEGPVAVKVLSERWTGNADIAGRFELECQKLAGAAEALGPDRANVVPRYIAHGTTDGSTTGGSTTGGTAYLITELCAGGSLAQRLPNLAELPGADRLGPAAWIMTRAAACLAAVHDQLELVHRDLTPSNLLFRQLPDGTEELAIADFGLVRESARASELSEGSGTAAYASPEVLERGVCDRRSDTYSLGVIAWELLSGQRPEAGAPVEPIGRLNPLIPYDVAATVEAMVAADPDQRPDLDQVTRAFNRHATSPPPPPDQVITPLPAARPARRRKRRRRWRGLLVALLAGLAAGVALGVRIGPAVTGQDAELRAFEPNDGGFVVELGPEWTIVDSNPPFPALLTASDREHGLELVVGGSLAGDAARFLETTTSGLSDEEILDSRFLDESRTWLHTRQDGTESIYYNLTRFCGTLVMLFQGQAPLPADVIARIEAIGDRFVASGGLVLPPAGAPPAGAVPFERNGISLAADASYGLEESRDHCLFLLSDGDPSIDVTFTPGAGAGIVAAQAESSWDETGAPPMERTETASGTTRLHGIDEEGGSEQILYVVDAGAGVFQVRVLARDQIPLTAAELADFDRVAATLELSR